MQVIFSGAAAVATLALFDATAPLGTGETTVASGSVRLASPPLPSMRSLARSTLCAPC